MPDTPQKQPWWKSAVEALVVLLVVLGVCALLGLGVVLMVSTEFGTKPVP